MMFCSLRFFSSSFLHHNFLLVLFYATYNIWSVQSYGTDNSFSLSLSRHCSYCSMFFLPRKKNRPTSITHDAITTYFPSSSEFLEHIARSSKSYQIHVRGRILRIVYMHRSIISILFSLFFVSKVLTSKKKHLKAKNDLMYLYTYVQHNLCQCSSIKNTYLLQKKSIDASTTIIIIMMKEKLCSRFTHSLIGLVARSSWPFFFVVCVCNSCSFSSNSVYTLHANGR